MVRHHSRSSGECFLQQRPILLASTWSSMGQDKKWKRVQSPPNCSYCLEASKVGVPLPLVLFASLFSYLYLGLPCILLQHRTASKSFLLTFFLLLTIINTTAYISQNIDYFKREWFTEEWEFTRFYDSFWIRYCSSNPSA